MYFIMRDRLRQMAYCINQSFSKAPSASGAFNYQQRFQKKTFFFFVVVLNGVSCSTHPKHPLQLHSQTLKQQRKLFMDIFVNFFLEQ